MWLDRVKSFRVQRDTVLFTTGLLGFAHELLLTNGDRPTLIYACMALMGLPLVLRDGDRRRDRGSS